MFDKFGEMIANLATKKKGESRPRKKSDEDAISGYESSFSVQDEPTSYNDGGLESLLGEKENLKQKKNIPWIPIGIIILLIIILIIVLTIKKNNSNQTPMLVEKKIDMLVGETTTLSSNLEGNKKNNIIWNSFNKKIIDVDSSGKVTALDTGRAIISATIKGGKTEYVVVSITTKEDKFSTTDENISLKVGATHTVETRDVLGEIVWTTTNSKIATVDRNGTVRGVLPGEVTIIGESNKRKVKVRFKVEGDFEAPLEIRNVKNIVYLGQTQKLEFDIKPEGSKKVNYTFESLTPDVVSVDSAGNITGLKIRSGSILVTSYNGISTVIDVEVERDYDY